MEKNFVLKGNISYSKDPAHLVTMEHGYVVCEEGRSAGVYKELPEKYAHLSVTDYGDKIIIPGMTDLHIHAPQYTLRGFGMDLELLEWLDTYTFPEEARYADLEYAKKAYEIFTQDLKKSVTTRACLFGTLHVEATELLMDMLEESGLITMAGKVNMDRNAPDYLCEESAEASIEATKRWLEDISGKYKNTMPILTPRFIPTCSDKLMSQLGELQKTYHLPVQSHLSENGGEIAWVKELCPNAAFYGDAYNQFHMFGGDCKTIMAHCVSSTEPEIALMEKQGVFIAHCPQSNSNLSSGIAPVREYLERNMKVGLGTDIAGGADISLLTAMADAIQVSKLYWRLVDDSKAPVNFEEVFYMATKGGGEFFGKAGSFEAGYEFDAVVLDDGNLKHPRRLSIKDRLERMIYLADDRNVTDKYVCGKKLVFS